MLPTPKKKLSCRRLISMGSRKCMNTACGANTTGQWKKGWLLKSGQPADLCSNCGSVYANLAYCDTFHLEESGWRECSLCSKRLHCGCSASVAFIQTQDFGGVWCISCAQPAASNSATRNGNSCEVQFSRNYSSPSDLHTLVSSSLDSGNVGDGKLLTLGNVVDNNMPGNLPQSHTDLLNGACVQLKPEANISVEVGGWNFPSLSHVLNGPALCAQQNDEHNTIEVKDMQEPQVPSLNISVNSPVDTSSFGLNFSSGLEEGDQGRSTFFQSGQRPRHILPKPPKCSPAKGYDANKSSFSPMRVARPPAEGRLRSQLLPRYWPRITDQELQKLSGDLNSTIVPLFEKILSASDASRIGRLVLPKACAEAYFPPINQSEGLPLKIQDVKGNEWTFQFRFWPNNNSRMYVLEGVNPCIQFMQLQAGDTVTFSRIDPGGKLVIGYRKASNAAIEMQDIQTSLVDANGAASGESINTHVTDGLSTGNGHIIPQSNEGDKDNVTSVLLEQSDMVIGDTAWDKCEKLKSTVNEDALHQTKLTPDKKRMRNISSRTKRLLMHGEDAIELKLSWEETQDLLRPPLTVRPNVVTVDGFEFEEYSEPPVFGKRTYFTARLSGIQEQWAQCDKCSKWRKLPADVLLPPKWSCSENVWVTSRSSCATPEEMDSKELEIVFRVNKDIKKRKGTESVELGQGCEPSGLDALATAATLGDHEEPTVGATTRHPRHRPGCSCIVCIQPPSGKGKHKPSCVCNVCLTVKRRFKTLMMRKKKRQCEREAEMAHLKNHDRQIERLRFTKKAASDDVMLDRDRLENEVHQEKFQAEDESSSKSRIDLNCHPIREEDSKMFAQSSRATTSRAETARDPLEMCIKVDGSSNSPLKQQTEGKCASPPLVDGSGVEHLSPKDDCHDSAWKVEDQRRETDGDGKKSISE